MWGNHRRNSTYHSCQPKNRSGAIPDGHPAHVYLNEERLNAAIFGFLNTAVFGPGRVDYWRACLTTPDTEQAAPIEARAAALDAELDELDRRLGRQILNLEADDMTPTLRRRIVERVEEIEGTIAERQKRRQAILAERDQTPTFGEIEPLLAKRDRCQPCRATSHWCPRQDSNLRHTVYNSPVPGRIAA